MPFDLYHPRTDDGTAPANGGRFYAVPAGAPAPADAGEPIGRYDGETPLAAARDYLDGQQTVVVFHEEGFFRVHYQPNYKLIQLRHVEDWALIRLSDGRPAIACNREPGKRNRVVKFSTGHSARLGNGEYVEVIQWPAQLAHAALAALEQTEASTPAPEATQA